MKIVKSILTNNPCYSTGKKIEVKGLMLHSVGCPQPKASVFINNWNRSDYRNACVHGFIDGKDGYVYQTLPWNHRGWHCGGSGNNTHIGIEMCEPAEIQYIAGSRFVCSDLEKAQIVAERTYKSAVEIFAFLCKEYDLNPLQNGVIVSHSEGYRKGIATNHGDPEHLWNGLQLGYTMDGFRRDVWDSMQNQNVGCDLEQSGSEEYLVRVAIPNLNIRKGSGTNYAEIGRYTGKGVFTIVEEAEGRGASKWGRLKSGAGWISLDYAERVD